jgi:ABC-type sugar transport system substrate-binding protein
MTCTRSVLGLLVAVGLLGLGAALAPPAITAASAQEQTQFIPVLAYRTGAYGFHGSAIIGGEEDYWTLLNERDGGIGGVRLRWQECEFAYDPARGVECYERLTGRGDASFINPLSTDLTYRLIDRATAAEIPLITIGYGRTDDRAAQNDEAENFHVAVVQNIDAAALELFAFWELNSLDRDGKDFEDINIGGIGARMKF